MWCPYQLVIVGPFIYLGCKGGWQKLIYEEITFLDKISLDITWRKDISLANVDNLPDPDVLAEEIAENLESALGSFRQIITQLKTQTQ